MKKFSPVNHQNLADTNFLVDGMVKTTEQATKPATPAAGTGGFYFKSDNLPYAQGDDGVERPLVVVTPAKHDNPSFDGVWTSTAHGMKPPGWDDFWMAAGVVANSYDTVNFVGGGGSAKITQPATGAIVQTSLQGLNCFGVLPGDVVTVSVWAKSDLPTPSLNIVIYTGTTCAAAAPFGAGTIQGRPFNGSAAWNLYTASFTVPAGDTFARIAFRGDAVGAGSFWWDESGSTVVTPTAPTIWVPPGCLMQFAGSAAPAGGWLLAQGQAVSRSTYSALFAVIGTTYGVGDGSTTFNVPNLSGRVAAGYDALDLSGPFGALAKTGGEKAHALTSTEQANMVLRTVDGPGYPIFSGAGSNQPGYLLANANSAGNAALQSIALGGGATGTAHNNVQPYLTVNYIIKT